MQILDNRENNLVKDNGLILNSSLDWDIFIIQYPTHF